MEARKHKVEGLIFEWKTRAEQSEFLACEYRRCSRVYKGADKIMRVSVALCSLVSAYTISFQSSRETWSNSVFYMEIIFSFAAAALSMVSQIVNFPTLREDQASRMHDYEQAQLHCWQQHNHCKWVRENLLDGCQDIAKVTVTSLSEAKRTYMGTWQQLESQSDCCFGVCCIIRLPGGLDPSPLASLQSMETEEVYDDEAETVVLEVCQTTSASGKSSESESALSL
uniref:Uncharacterized protein n=1 Tax=viral metagenome TaxID=1070528 RepID=A0A6C0KB08_9ZZZZ